MMYFWMFTVGLFLLIWSVYSILDIVANFSIFKPRYVFENFEFSTQVWLVSVVIVPTFISFIMYIGG